MADELERQVAHADHVCPMCKQNAWTRRDDLEKAPLGEFHTAFLRVCGNCGFVALYSRQWAQQ
jgi:hypothetical protein